MKLNGNLTLNGLGASEIQNLVIERVVATPVFNVSEAGRIIFNTGDKKYYMNNGTAYVALATGGDASALLNEVNSIEASLGAATNADGTFNAAAFTGANIVAATSITDAINKLDNAVTGKNELVELLDVSVAGALHGQFMKYNSASMKWEKHTFILGDVTDVTATVAEVNQLVGVTSGVQAQLNAEATARAAADTTLTTNLAAEVTRATGAEGTLTTNLTAEITRATGAEATNAAAIIAEATARASADAVVASDAAALVSTENTQRTASDVSINARIDVVQGELDITQAGAGLGVTGVYTAPAATTYLGLASSLANADVLLDAAITAEAVARAAADTGFQTALTAEQTARIAADANLATTIQAYVDGQVAINAGADTLEVNARIAADAAIQAELNTTQVGAGLAIDGTYTTPVGTNYLGTSVSLNAADLLLDTAVKANAVAITAEVAARTATDLQINSDLTTEIATRIALDTAHQAELDAIEGGAGLEGNGSYATPVGTNYLNLATSLKDADFILDLALKAEAVRATAAETANASAISAETARATTAEGVNSAAIAAETSRATAAEGTISGNLAAEVTRATGAEGTLTTNLSAEVTRAVSAEAALTAKVNKMYFLFNGVSATSHVVAHALGQQFCNVTVIDSATNEQIIPQSVVFDTANQLTVTFNTALACKVVVMGLA